METRLLGRTGLRVSRLCLGTMSFGREADEAEAGRIYAAARERGINFFDCADSYVAGRSEEILGRLAAPERDQLILTTKCFNPMGRDPGSPGPNDRGGNRRHVTRAVEDSLRRLGTDRVEVLFMHRWDPDTPLEETLRALEDLVRAGKVLHIGASNYAAWQVARGLGISERRGWARFDVIQPMYSLVKRQAEAEILPLARAEGLGVITYSPVGGGLLSGKYGPGRRPEGARIVTNREYAARYGEDWAHACAGTFTALAEARGVHPVSLAVAWVAAHADVTAPIVGARNLEQLRPALAALEVPMTPELRAEVSALSRTPPPATDRLEEAQ
ncbi:MAG TPA: aldo/keto reductase [Thermohalobaculum sp.]|nr:aldo/keto reductase [Thermohalobaculum sp.]